MTGLRILVLFCVVIVQRAASQSCSCQSDLYISIDDLLKALNNGPGIPGLIESSNQSQECGCQSSGNSCGCPSGQNSISVNQQASSQSSQSCGCRPTVSINSLPSISLGQSCGPQQSSVSVSSAPSISLGQSCSCNRPSISLGQPISASQSSGCGCKQPSLSLSSLPLSLGQGGNQASFTIPSQPSLSISQQSSPSISLSQPRQSISFQPLSLGKTGSGTQISLNSNSQSCGCQSPQSNIQISSDYEGNCVVPAALLQAPPYGIIFAGENLLIDGAVQVCGNMPFNSLIELGGILPTSGSGCVQYVCNDLCS